MTEAPIGAQTAPANPQIAFQELVQRERAAWDAIEALPDGYTDDECTALVDPHTDLLYELVEMPAPNLAAIITKVEIFDRCESWPLNDFVETFNVQLVADLRRLGT